MTDAGVPDPQGLPFRALVASIAQQESGGNPSPAQGDPTKGGSDGLYQVNKPSWPDIHAKVLASMASGKSDHDKAVEQTQAVKPILEDASSAAMEAGRILGGRGFVVAPEDLMLLVDAAWQRSRHNLSNTGLLDWARKTTTGNVTEVDARAPSVLESIRSLAGSKWGGLWALLGVLGIGAAILVALEDWTVDGESD